jgi:hypothetical protein
MDCIGSRSSKYTICPIACNGIGGNQNALLPFGVAISEDERSAEENKPVERCAFQRLASIPGGIPPEVVTPGIS